MKKSSYSKRFVNHFIASVCYLLIVLDFVTPKILGHDTALSYLLVAFSLLILDNRNQSACCTLD